MTECGRKFLRRKPEMHKVTEASSITLPVFVLSAARLTEIRDWGEFRVKWSTGVPPVV